MPVRQNSTQQERWAGMYAASVFLLLMFFMVRHINIYLWNSLHSTIFAAAVPAMAAWLLCMGGLYRGLEVKLLFAYCMWFFISRMLNGGSILVREFAFVLEYGVFFLVGSLGLVLNAAQREKALKWTGGFVCAYYTLLSVISIFCSLLRITIVNPLTEANICKMGEDGFVRLVLMDTNPNITAVWFFITFFTLIYFIFSCRHKFWCVLIVPAAALNYFALTLTYCRNMKMGFSACIAMLVMLLALKFIPRGKLWLKIPAVILAAVIFLPLSYKSFNGAELLLPKASAALRAKVEIPAPSPEPSKSPIAPRAAATVQPLSYRGTDGAERLLPSSAGTSVTKGTAASGKTEDEEYIFSDPRDFDKSLSTLSDRTPIFKSVLATLEAEPMRLLRGCPSSKVMSVANQLGIKNVHFHNSLLQVLVYTGLVGFIIVVLYYILLLIRMVRCFFSVDERAKLSVKLLILPLAGMMIYSMLEPMLFYYTDFTALYFFFVAGMFLGYSYELHPPRRRKQNKES